MAEIGIRYTLVTPSGNIEFNVGGDGYDLTSVNGLDGASLRTTVDNLPMRDGAAVSDSYKGPLYPVLEGTIRAFSDPSLIYRRQLEDDLKGKLNSIVRADGQLQWQPRGATSTADFRQIAVRLFESVSIGQSDAILKTFHFSLVAADPTIYSQVQNSMNTQPFGAPGSAGTFVMPFTFPIGFGNYTAPGTVTVTNSGSVNTYPLVRVFGNVTGITIKNATTNQTMAFPALSIPMGSYMDVDMKRETVTYNSLDTFPLLSYLDVANSQFFPLVPGDNQIQISVTSTDGTAYGTVFWTNAYA